MTAMQMWLALCGSLLVSGLSFWVGLIAAWHRMSARDVAVALWRRAGAYGGRVRDAVRRTEDAQGGRHAR
jgi:hypothetical protein